MAQHISPEPAVVGQHGGHEIYPMPMFGLLETDDVQGLVAWYRDALGFAVVFEMPVLVHLRRSKYQDVLVRFGERRDGSGAGISLCFQANGDAGRIAERAGAAPVVGRSHVEPPADTPWNTRDVRITDPEERTLIFTEPRFDPEAGERMRRQFGAAGGGRS